MTRSRAVAIWCRVFGLGLIKTEDNDVNLPIPCSTLGYVNVEKSCMVLKKWTTSLWWMRLMENAGIGEKHEEKLPV